MQRRSVNYEGLARNNRLHMDVQQKTYIKNYIGQANQLYKKR